MHIESIHEYRNAKFSCDINDITKLQRHLNAAALLGQAREGSYSRLTWRDI
jgi:hypothetical protein